MAFGPSSHRSLHFPPRGCSFLLSGPSPNFHLPTLNRLPQYRFPGPLSSALRAPRSVSVSDPRPHGAAGAAELGGGLPQDPVSLPRGAEPGFRLRLRGVPPGGAQFRPEGELAPGQAPRRESACSHEVLFVLDPSRALELPLYSAHFTYPLAEYKL